MGNYFYIHITYLVLKSWEKLSSTNKYHLKKNKIVKLIKDVCEA